MTSILPPNSEQSNHSRRPLLIGEVLFDRFPDEKKILGGAPFNVAWNLRGFEQNPVFVSAVGQDQAADEIRQKMNHHGMDLSGLQTNEYPTGNVQVSFNDGEPSYEIEPDQAWDYLSAQDPDLRRGSLSDDIAIIYHGSLIWRNPTSRAAVETLRSENDATVFVDLNIRQPWFKLNQVAEILSQVDSLKLSLEELATITGRELPDDEAIASASAETLAKHSLASLWVTAGADGAHYFDNQGQTEFAEASKIENLADTVGAGDAFSAAVINGILNGREPKLILANAVKFAAKVCGLQGATTDDKDFYSIP